MTEIGWLLTAYSIGTVIGIGFGFNWAHKRSIIMTIDSLIDQGFLRHRKDKDGETEILKWNHVEDCQN